jgi:hypothetical protein
MQVAVLIEPNRPQGFRATAPAHPDVTGEGLTEDAAVQTLSDRLSKKLKQARMVTVEIPVKADKPWMAAAGCLKDEPDLDAYWDAILEYRRQRQAKDDVVAARLKILRSPCDGVQRDPPLFGVNQCLQKSEP